MDPSNTPSSNTLQNGKKILICEDEKFIADLYEHVLTKAGYLVKTAPDGRVGLDMLTKEHYDLLLLDVMMPEINGLELLRQWKLKNPTSQMVILMLTNLGQDAVIKEAFNLGASGYLIKASLTPQQVLTEVANTLSPKQPVIPS